MNTSIICAIISLSGVIVSAIFSYLISVRASRHEARKMLKQWERDDNVELRNLIQNFIEAMRKYQNRSADVFSFVSPMIESSARLDPCLKDRDLANRIATCVSFAKNFQNIDNIASELSSVLSKLI